MKYKRINLFGGPGCGKSTTMAWLWSELKIAGYSIEAIPEWVKKWAYEKRPIESFDEIYSFAKQMSKEDFYLRAGADLVISDSPILMIGAYSKRANNLFTNELINLANIFEKLYPSINIFLKRDNINYQQTGRYENYEEAIRMDSLILEVMNENLKNVYPFNTSDRQSVLEFIQGILCKTQN